MSWAGKQLTKLASVHNTTFTAPLIEAKPRAHTKAMTVFLPTMTIFLEYLRPIPDANVSFY